MFSFITVQIILIFILVLTLRQTLIFFGCFSVTISLQPLQPVFWDSFQMENEPQMSE